MNCRNCSNNNIKTKKKVATVADLICLGRFLTPTTLCDEMARAEQKLSEPVKDFRGAKEGLIFMDFGGSFQGPLDKFLCTRFTVSEHNYISGITIGSPIDPTTVFIAIVNSITHEKLACQVHQTKGSTLCQEINFKSPGALSANGEYILLIRYAHHRRDTIIFHLGTQAGTIVRRAANVTYKFTELSQCLINLRFKKLN